MDITTQDNLGISPKEDLKMEALSLGASPEEVASTSKQSESTIPSYIPSYYSEDDEQSFSEDSLYLPKVNPISKEKASSMAMFASLADKDQGEITSKYKEMYEQLYSEGTSPLYSSIKETVKNMETDDLERDIYMSARDGDVNTTQSLLKASDQVIQERSNLRRAGLESAAEDYLERTPEDPRNLEHAREFIVSLGNDIDNNGKTPLEVLDDQINREIASSDSGLLDYFSDSYESGLLGEQAAGGLPLLGGLSTASKEVLGERYNFLGGTMMRDFARKWRNAPDSEKEVLGQEIVDAISKNSGVLPGNDNDVVKVFALETLRDFAKTPGGDIPFDRWLSDIVGFSELVAVLPVGSAIKLFRRIKQIKRLPSTFNKYTKNISRNQVGDANPDLDAILSAEAIRREETAAQLGSSQADELERAMPSNSIDEDIHLAGAPNSVVEKIQGLKTISEEVEHFTDNTYLFHAADYIRGEQRLINTFSDEKMVGRVKPAFSTMSRDDNSNILNIAATYGNELDIPLNLGQAKKLSLNLKKMADEQELKGTEIDILVKDKNSGTFKTYSREAHGTDGEFLVKLKAKAPLFYEDIGPVEKNLQTTSAGGKLLGPLARTWANANQFLNKTLLGASRVALSQKFYVRHNLLRIGAPFFNLSYSSKRKVASLLKEGEEYIHLGDDGMPTGQVGRTYKYSDLEGRYSNKEIEGYFSARLVSDAVYNIKNADIRSRLIRDGYRGLSVALPGEKYFKNGAKIADDKEILEGASVIFDVINNIPVRATQQKLNELAANGMVVVRLLKKADTSSGKYSFAVVKKDDLHELPQRIYPYREGYNYRVNNDPYFIDRLENVKVDGKVQEYRSTIGVARSAQEAESFIKKAEEVNNFPPTKKGPSKFSYRWDRSIAAEKSALADDADMLDGSGMQFWFSERGPRLTRIDGSLSSVEDPIAAIHKMVGATANVSTHAELLETAAIRHRKTYGHLKTEDGRSVWNYDRVTQSWVFDKDLARSLKTSESADALNEYIHLENIKFTPTYLDEKWKDVLERIDIMFSKVPEKISFLSKGSTKVTSTLAKTTPGQVTRGAAYSMSIPLRPARHILLQGTTGAHLTGIDPALVLGSFVDASLMMFALASYQKPSRWKWALGVSKLFGYSEEEFTEVFEAFRKSGVPFSVDSHVAVGEMNFDWSRNIPDTYLGRAGQVAKNIAISPITIGKNIGFNPGELYNLAVTWMFAQKRFKKLNPDVDWKSQRAIDEITNKGRNYAIDMTNVSQFNYQKGAFASMTQFLAINHKMILNILGQDPEIGSIFKKGQRAGHARYLLGLMAVYGTAGLGLHEIYDSWIKSTGIEIDPTLDDVLYGGFSQALWNISWDLALGNERGTTRTAFSASVAPTAGAINFIPEFIESVMDNDIPQAFSGPFSSTFKSLYIAGTYIQDMWAIRDDLNAPQKVLKSFQIGYGEFGAFSDYYKYQMMMAYNDRMGKLMIVGKDGRPTVEANSWGEIWSKSIFNIGTRGEEEFFNNYLDMYRDLNSTGKDQISIYDDDADHLVKYMYDTWRKYPDVLERTERMKAITFALHNGPDKRYGQNVLMIARNKFKLDPRFDEFVADMTETVAKGMFDADFNLTEMRNSVRNSDGMPEEDKQRLIEAIDQMDISREKSRILMNDHYSEYDKDKVNILGPLEY